MGANQTQRRALILGAAGRDFHNFNTVFRDDPSVQVVAFTATQIPNIDGRLYPPVLSGPLYPEGIPIVPETAMESWIQAEHIDEVIFSYSDLSHTQVMQLASRALAAGADFRLLRPERTMLKSKRPVISICAVRTGCGKSPTTRHVATFLRRFGLRVGIVRHPMPYGDLQRQIVQRFASLDDLRNADCTIEEMEEYEPHIENGDVVYAGVDFAEILKQVESDAEVILWDGGNNDTPFFQPNLEITLLDTHRVGHERTYFPGEVNFLRADVLLLTKLDSAEPANVARLKQTIATYRPDATVVSSEMALSGERIEEVQGKRVLVIEDGPTLTHGGMSFGAGLLAAQKWGASVIVDPREAAVGSIRETYAKYPHITEILPAMGYGQTQMEELAKTIERVDCDLVLMATPVDLRRFLPIKRPVCRVRYDLKVVGSPTLADVLNPFVKEHFPHKAW